LETPDRKGTAQEMKTALRILNLEDNANDAELNGAMIAARWPQCELVRVETREEFTSALDQGNFDLILSDYTMPGFGGREALTLARQKRPQTPFLFVSGTIGEDAAIEALKNGATDYVLKHRLMRLIPAVDRALREREERAERERAEEAMRESEYKYRELFESLSDAAFLADAQGEKIIDTNRRAEELLGCSRSEILGRAQSQFLALEKFGARGFVPMPFHSELIRPSGPTVPVEVRTTQLTLYGRPLILRLCQVIGGPE
jgi:PAS domain S-box-containing protein